MGSSEIINSIKSIDYKGIIAEYVLHNIADFAIKNLKNQFKDRKLELETQQIFDTQLSVSEEIVLKEILYNFNKTYNWCKEIHLKSAIESKDLFEIFIDLDLYIAQIRDRFEPDETLPIIKSNEIFNNIDKNIIIYGGPGAGKSTLMMNICRQIFDTEHSLREFTCPIVIQFRDVNYPKRKKDYPFTLYNILVDTFGINIKFPKIDDDNINHNNIQSSYLLTLKSTVTQFIDDSNILLIFDGFDEIPDLEIKNRVEKDFHELALGLNKSKFIITSRNGEFNSSLANTRKYEICPLNDEQILCLSTKWLKDDEIVKDFIGKIKVSPFYDTAIRPLTITHLCIIYERKKTIPPKPSSVYKYVVELLVEKWDDQRKATRTSSYGEMFLSDMTKFLFHVAFELSYYKKTSLFTSNDLEKCYKKICERHNLPLHEAKKVVREIESHNGLIIQVGYDSYQFTHKSLQEYLTAEHLTGLSTFPSEDIIISLPNEIAISLSLSTDNTQYFVFFHQNIKKFSFDYWLVLLNRINLEKPNFTDKSTSLIFFVSLLSLKFSTIDPYTEKEYKTIKKIIVEIFKQTNIKIGLTSFYGIYKKHDEIQNFLIFHHRNLDYSLDKRYNQDGRLYIEKDIYKLLS